MNIKSIEKVTVYIFALLIFQAPVGFCADLSIDEAVNMALQNNLDIKIAAKQEEVAKANLDSTEAAQGVTVSLSNKLSASDGVSDGISQDFDRGSSTSVSASYPLYTGGKNQLNINIKKQYLQQSELNTQRTAENIKYNTIKAYYDILEAKRTIGVDQESVSNYEKHLTNVQQLYTAGSKPKSDLLRSEVSLADARQTLIKAQNDYDVDVITLKNIIKMNRDEELNLTEDFQYIPFDRQLADCLSYAAENRKDLKESQIDYDVAQKNVELAKVGYKPTVSASVGTSWNTQMLPSVSNHGYTVGLSTSWDIFDNGLTKADVASAEAALDEAQLTLQQKSDNIDLAVRQAYLDMREAEKRFNSTQTAVDQAEEDMFIAQEKYRVGAGVILDVIDAQLALSTAELNHISAQYDYARDKAELENAMGLNEEIAG